MSRHVREADVKIISTNRKTSKALHCSHVIRTVSSLYDVQTVDVIGGPLWIDGSHKNPLKMEEPNSSTSYTKWKITKRILGTVQNEGKQMHGKDIQS